MSGRSRQLDRCPQALQSPLAVYAMARHASPDVPTVLLVENVQDDRAMYAEYLRLLRFRVIGIGAARPPYRQAATADLVVTGIRVPGPYDGVELIRQLREATDTRRMPVIVLTACAFESDQLRAQQAGCDLFLPKPCLPDTLAGAIRRLLLLRSAWRKRQLRAQPPVWKKKDTA